MATNKIKHIVFDIGNVLVDFHPKEYMLALGFSERTAEVLLEKMVFGPIWGEFDRSLRPQKEVIGEIKASLPEYTKEIDLFFEKIEDIVSPRAYSKGWLREMRQRGYQVYLLSNYPDELFAIHAKTVFDFLSETDGKIVSGYVKQVKPEPEIYQTLLDTYKLCPEECVFIDDRPENVEAAVKLNMKGIVFTTYEEVREALENLL